MKTIMEHYINEAREDLAVNGFDEILTDEAKRHASRAYVCYETAAYHAMSQGDSAMWFTMGREFRLQALAAASAINDVSGQNLYLEIENFLYHLQDRAIEAVYGIVRPEEGEEEGEEGEENLTELFEDETDGQPTEETEEVEEKSSEEQEKTNKTD